MAQPRGRQKNITGQGASVSRRGSGTGAGHVGSGSFMGSGGSRPGSSGVSGGPVRSGGGRGKLFMIIVILFLVLGGGGGGLASLLGGGGGSDTAGTAITGSGSGSGSGSSVAGLLDAAQSSTGAGSLASLLGGGTGLYGSVSGTSAAWTGQPNTGTLNRNVAAGARDRYTTLLGDGQDTVTVMVYMCGTDLESKSGMATNDLQEMLSADVSGRLNLIVYTGGCWKWKNNIVASDRNQIYQITGGKMRTLEDDAGTGAMTDPATLTSFIQYGTKNFPANRNILIFWDHGGGSVSGYGYDEKNASKGSMTLAGIDTALKNAGTTFDIIGFDTCLMATVETDLMIAQYADYIVASEETEPGVGWYYTNWLTSLSQNTSMDSLDLSKQIIDDFVDTCARTCSGQKCTLSVVDLAELSETLPADFKEFSRSTTKLITDGGYQTVSDARSGAREFAQSSKIDQIDLVQFAQGIGTDEAKELAGTLLEAVKYNRTSSNMTNAYGVSVYFPYRKTSSVGKAVSTYDQIGLGSEYSDCIREFASLELSGQAVTGGASYGGSGLANPLEMLTGGGSGASVQGLDSVLSLVSAFSGNSALSGIFGGRSLSDADRASFITDHQFDASALVWKFSASGDPILPIAADQWELIHSVDLNMYVDDGNGYIDMGLDNLFDIDEAGNLIPDTDGTWISVNGQPVAYYHVDTVYDGDEMTVTGYIPAYLNDNRVRLVVIFDPEHPTGYIAGADPDYDPSYQTDTVSRGLLPLEVGDFVDFVADYYSYDGEFIDSFFIGSRQTVTGALTVSDTYLSDDHIALYRFTDLYNQNHWSPRLP
ncbi:MAG: peptidase C11 [Lachnospiraceae bacterium]|nr:peptidase C11 [Lachnospiraceae bacterium]